MRFDQWIKLFDNIVTMSNWTDEEIVTVSNKVDGCCERNASKHLRQCYKRVWGN